MGREVEEELFCYLTGGDHVTCFYFHVSLLPISFDVFCVC